jgi:hypothetical protein
MHRSSVAITSANFTLLKIGDKEFKISTPVKEYRFREVANDKTDWFAVISNLSRTPRFKLTKKSSFIDLDKYDAKSKSGKVLIEENTRTADGWRTLNVRYGELILSLIIVMKDSVHSKVVAV